MPFGHGGEWGEGRPKNQVETKVEKQVDISELVTIIHRMPDETNLKSVYEAIRGGQKKLGRHGQPTDSLVSAYLGLSRADRSEFKHIIGALAKSGGINTFSTFGSVRKTNDENLAVVRGIGNQRLSLARQLFPLVQGA